MGAAALALQIRDANGVLDSGAQINAFQKNTATRQDVFTDSALAVVSTNPALANSAGRVTLYLDDTKSYTLTVLSSDGATTYFALDYTAGATNPWTSSGTITPTIGTFTSDGTAGPYALTVTPNGAEYLILTGSGVTQHASDFTLSGNEVTFDTAPASGLVFQYIVLAPSAYSLALVGSETVLEDNSSLAAATNASAGQYIRTRGGAVSGDGGDGLWLATTTDHSAEAAADTGNGLYIASTGSTGIYWVRQYEGRVSHKWFEGASNQQKIERMFAAAPEFSQLRITGAVTITSAISTAKSFDIDATGATFTCTANVRMFEFIASGAQVVDLSADYAAGDTAINVDTLTAAPGRSSIHKIFSDANDPEGRDQGSEALQYRKAAWLRVKTGTKTQLTLERALDDIQGVDPTSTSGDEPLVNAYTQALNAKVIILEDKDMRWKGGTFAYEDGHDADVWNSELLTIAGFTRPVVEEITITRGYYHGVSLKGCAFAVVQNCDISGLTDDTSLGQFGYGVVDQGCYGTKCYNVNGDNNRHLLTTSTVLANADETNLERLLGSGTCDLGHWDDCIGSGGNVNPIDLHHGARGYRITNCASEDTGGAGLQVRGRDIVVENFRGTNIAFDLIQVRTDFSSGQSDDDNWTANKELGPTTCSIDGLIGDCRRDVIRAIGAREVLVAGNVRVSNAATRKILCQGSNVLIDAQMRLETTDLNGSATIDSTANAAVFESTYESTLPHAQGIVFQAGDVFVDLTNADGTGLKLASAEENTFIVARCRVRALLNADFVAFDDTSGYQNTIEGGPWVISQAGDDDQIPINFAEHPGNLIETPDKTGLLDTLDNTTELKHVQRNNALGLTATHGGGTTTWTHTPDDLSHKALDVANGRLEEEITGTKSGTGGTATVAVSLGGGATLLTAILPAATTDYEVKAIVLCTADNAQDVIIKGHAEGGGTVTPIFERATATVDLSAASQHLSFVGTPSAGDTLTARTSDTYGSAVVKGFAS